MVLDLLRREKIMVVQGTASTGPRRTLPRGDTADRGDLTSAITRIGNFLDGYGQP